MERKTIKCKKCGRLFYYNGISLTDRKELVGIFFFWRRDDKKENVFVFPQDEIDYYIREICCEIEETGDLDKESELFKWLFNYRDIDTTEIAEAAFKKELFYPEEMYRNAPDYVIKSIIETLMRDDINSMLASRLLGCLAVHGGEDVFKAFLELEKHPREWRKSLYVAPSVYATFGGWSYDKDGNFVRTNFDKCYPMVRGTPEGKLKSPVKIGVRTNEKCPKCGGAVVNLIEIDGRDKRLDFLELDGTVKVKFCPMCFSYGDGEFGEYTLDGESELLYGKDSGDITDGPDDEVTEELVSNNYVLGDSPVPLRYPADWEGGCAVGGYAFWIEDCEIRNCPKCGRPMKYLAQIQWDNVLKYMEGNAYIEICRDCKVTALLHQQT